MLEGSGRARTRSDKQYTNSVLEEVKELREKCDAANAEQFRDLLDKHLASKEPEDRPQWLQTVASSLGTIGRDKWLKSLAMWIIEQGDEKSRSIVVQNGGKAFNTYLETVTAQESRRVVTAKQALEKIWQEEERIPSLSQDKYGVPSKYTVPNDKSWPRYRQICAEAAHQSRLKDVWTSIIPSAIQRVGYGVLTQPVLDQVYAVLKTESEEVIAIGLQAPRGSAAAKPLLKRDIDQVDFDYESNNTPTKITKHSTSPHLNAGHTLSYPSPMTSCDEPDIQSPDFEVGRRGEPPIMDEPLESFIDSDRRGTEERFDVKSLSSHIQDKEYGHLAANGETDHYGIRPAEIDLCDTGHVGDSDEIMSNGSDSMSEKNDNDFDGDDDDGFILTGDFDPADPSEQNAGQPHQPSVERDGDDGEVQSPPPCPPSPQILQSPMESPGQIDQQTADQVSSLAIDKHMAMSTNDFSYREKIMQVLSGEQELTPLHVGQLSQRWEKPWLSVAYPETIQVRERYDLPNLKLPSHTRANRFLIPLLSDSGCTCVISITQFTSPVVEVYILDGFEGKRTVQAAIGLALSDPEGNLFPPSKILFQLYPRQSDTVDDKIIFLEVLHRLSSGLPVSESYQSKTLREYFRRQIMPQQTTPPILADRLVIKNGGLETLKPGVKLNDSTIEQALKLVVGPHDMILDPSWADPRMLLNRRLRVRSDVQLLILPVEHTGHWTVNVLDRNSHMADHYDSYFSHTSEYTQRLNSNLQCCISYGKDQEGSRHFFEDKTWEIRNKVTPRQPDLVDCGIFTIAVCIYRVCGVEPPVNIDAPLWRSLIHVMVSSLHSEQQSFPDFDPLATSMNPTDPTSQGPEAAYSYYEAAVDQALIEATHAQQAHEILSRLAARRREDFDAAVGELEKQLNVPENISAPYEALKATFVPELHAKLALLNQENEKLRKSARDILTQWLDSFSVTEGCILNAVSFARYVRDKRCKRVDAVKNKTKKWIEKEDRVLEEKRVRRDALRRRLGMGLEV